MMTFSGERISWLAWAREALLARAAASAIRSFAAVEATRGAFGGLDVAIVGIEVDDPFDAAFLNGINIDDGGELGDAVEGVTIERVE